MKRLIYTRTAARVASPPVFASEPTLVFARVMSTALDTMVLKR